MLNLIGYCLNNTGNGIILINLDYLSPKLTKISITNMGQFINMNDREYAFLEQNSLYGKGCLVLSDMLCPSQRELQLRLSHQLALLLGCENAKLQEANQGL